MKKLSLLIAMFIVSVMSLSAQSIDEYFEFAKQGDAEAQYALGTCYETGYGVTQSYADAVVWYQKAAEQGNAKAQSNLGYCYYNGFGVAMDYKLSISFR